MDDFYTKIARRKLVDHDIPKEEVKVWEKSFLNSNDITVWSFRNIWLRNTKTNLEEFEYFNLDHSVKVFLNELSDRPCILVGAGPSLEKNINHLKTAKEMGVSILCSNHAFMYLNDIGVKPDYVCMLDAGGQWNEYLAGDSEGVPLLADVTCDTRQLKTWKGPIQFFSSIVSEKSNAGKYFMMERDRILPRNKVSQFETGGHVGGAMLVIARNIMMAQSIIFTGYDYCFNSDKKFYPFDKQIDKEWIDEKGGIHQSMPFIDGAVPDIFGNPVETDGSYMGFKKIIETSVRTLCMGGNAEFINACEGGALGSVPGGLSKWMQYKKLEDVLIAIKGG